MRLLRTFLVDERAELAARGIRLMTIGDEARLPALVRAAAGGADAAHARGTGR